MNGIFKFFLNFVKTAVVVAAHYDAEQSAGLSTIFDLGGIFGRFIRQ